jgi:hypothetical protein
MGAKSRRWLNSSTQMSVAGSMTSQFFHDCRWITSALYNPLLVWAKALSSESPTLFTEGSIPASPLALTYYFLRTPV